MVEFPQPSRTDSLLLSFRSQPTTSFLVVGSNRLAASRVFAALEANFSVFVAYGNGAAVDPEIKYRVATNEIRHIEVDDSNLLDIMSEIPGLAIVCVTDSLVASSRTINSRSFESCALISQFCLSRKIHVNIVDRTSLNDISFPATHRWRTRDHQEAYSLQIAVNTFGKGCRLATRIKREIVSCLPAEIGRAVDNIAALRSKIMDLPTSLPVMGGSDNTNPSLPSNFDEEDDKIISEPLNTPVAQMSSPRTYGGYFPTESSAPAENDQEARARRMKWVAQVSEYWPIKTIGRLQEVDIDRILADFDDTTTPAIPTANPTPLASRSASHTNLAVLDGGSLSPASTTPALAFTPSPLRSIVTTSGSTNHAEYGTPGTLHNLNISRPIAINEKAPRVLLLGSGPGHPALLTVAAANALRTADLVLADKLVPAPVLQLIPASVETIIAKKFPGNAENAQIELQQLALNFVLQRRAEGRGGTVVRLKQGDPYIYGRGGEEVLFFRAHGIETIVIPGISSAIAAPLLCNIPVTQRGVSDSLILCTGVGRAGKTSIMPGFRRSRTLIVLMGVARIGELITALTSDSEVIGTRREAEKYPGHLPIALIERGSSRDQRMLLSTLSGIEAAIERVGDQRPPGMLVIGWCCLALEGEGHVDVTELIGLAAGEDGDRARVRSVLGERGYLVRDGVRDDWMDFLNELALVK